MVVGRAGSLSDLPCVQVAAGRIFSMYFNSSQFYEKGKHSILCEEVTNKGAYYKEANRNSSSLLGSGVTYSHPHHTFSRHLPQSPLIATTCPSLVFFLLEIHPEVRVM